MFHWCIWSLFLSFHPLTHQVSQHNLHHIIWIFHTEYSEQLIILGSCLYNYNITYVLIFKVNINKFPRKSFWPVTPLLDNSCSIDKCGFYLCDTFGNKKSLCTKPQPFLIKRYVYTSLTLNLPFTLNHCITFYLSVEEDICLTLSDLSTKYTLNHNK